MLTEFVTFAPAHLMPGVLYVSMEYATVLHACCCGCGNKVVTPLAPERWSLTYDGRHVTIGPSVGNWSFPCQSHYWIERNEVVWDRPFTRAEITAVRDSDQRALRGTSIRTTQKESPAQDEQSHASVDAVSWWRRLLRRLA